MEGQFLSLEQLSPQQTSTLYGLYLDCFSGMPINKWSEDGFKDIIKLMGVGCLFYATTEQKLIAFIIWRIIADEAEILNIGVVPKFRKNAIATMLLDKLKNIAQLQGVTSVFLEVGQVNKKAIALYNKHGFTNIARRKAYYESPTQPADDALVMRLSL